MMVCGVFLSKGAGQTDWLFLFLSWDSDLHSDAWTAVGLHRFLLLYLGYRFGLELHLAWCSWIIHGGVLAGYVNLTVSTY